ncbi:hypothetical protein GSI_07165 [Ganoderma sinense ZZ0214-1]|uniref:H/ACA ribonucleoprotein complex subunit n=1 Tax=Ganoderma sinense ZZ0214-1 TaxID=1077348 RepID=A0A2G8S9N6_9APHY|nr:hypothetical protein GSI_07165 [Ganoderma sinense ZZ0214-1]
MGTFMHAVEDEMLCQSVMPDKVPYFNAPIYLQNKSVIGRVDEILGPINEVYFSVKMGDGMVASSFKKGDKVYIGGDKLLPIDRFLPKPKAVSKNRAALVGGEPLVDGDEVVLVGAVVLEEAGVVLVVDEVYQEEEVALAVDLVVEEGVHREDVVEEVVASVAAAGFNEWIRGYGCCTSLFAI